MNLRPRSTALLCIAVALPVAGAVPSRASDAWTRSVTTAPTIAGCSPGALTIGLGCLRIGGAVETSMAVAAVPSWRTNMATSHAPSSAQGGSTTLSQPSVAARLSADVRMPTELGPVRAYVSVRNLPARRADGF